MSVPKSQRDIAVSQFIQDIITVRKTTISMTNKFPASYSRKTTNLLLQMAQEAFEFAIKGNDIYFSKTTPSDAYRLRSEYFRKSHGALKTLSAEITFCLALVDEGNNFLGKRTKYLNQFHVWGSQVIAALSTLKGVMESDKRRWKEWHPQGS